jgi:hypothetical protein
MVVCFSFALKHAESQYCITVQASIPSSQGQSLDGVTNRLVGATLAQ